MIHHVVLELAVSSTKPIGKSTVSITASGVFGMGRTKNMAN